MTQLKQRVRLMRLRVDKTVVKALIAARGMTYRSLAAAADSNAGSISDLANGKRVDAKEETALGIEDALGLPRGTLFMQIETSIDLGEKAA